MAAALPGLDPLSGIAGLAGLIMQSRSNNAAIGDAKANLANVTGYGNANTEAVKGSANANLATVLGDLDYQRTAAGQLVGSSGDTQSQLLDAVLRGTGGVVNSARQGANDATDTAISNALNATNFAKSYADQNTAFAKAPRTDAFGNTTSYDDQLGQWLTQLSPQQQRLINAGQHEQELQLTQDASKSRDLRNLDIDRARQASDDYNTMRTGYLNNAAPSQGSIEDTLTRLGVRSIPSGSTSPIVPADIQALRGARGVSSQPRPSGSNLLAQAQLSARQNALNELSSRESLRQQKYMPGMQAFGQAAGYVPTQGPNADVSKIGQGAADQQQQMSDLVKQIMMNNQGTLGNAITSGGNSILQTQQQGSANTTAALTDQINRIASAILQGGQGNTNAIATGASGVGGAYGLANSAGQNATNSLNSAGQSTTNALNSAGQDVAKITQAGTPNFSQIANLIKATGGSGIDSSSIGSGLSSAGNYLGGLFNTTPIQAPLVYLNPQNEPLYTKGV